MAVQMQTETRPPVTLETRCSAYVREGAVRLFTSGGLAKLRYVMTEDDHAYFSIPSESQAGILYQLDYDLHVKTIRCSCPAGQHNVPCKHVELWRLSRGFAVEGRA